MALETSNFLPEESIPQNLTGCQTEIRNWRGTVTEPTTIEGEDREQQPAWRIDYGRGDIGTQPDEILRRRILAIPEEIND
jgi:hypothetical protein